MADNFTASPGAGGDTFAADEIAGVKYPRSKIIIGADGVNDGDVSASNPLPTTLQAVGAEYWPGYSGSPDPSNLPLHVDPSGALITRGAVTTDEGTFRVNFANTSLAVSIGSVTVAGDTVTGSGFLSADVHYKDYFKLGADGESAWMGIASVDSDTQITLRTTYTGGSSGAASRALIRPVTGSGGGISVASGQCAMTTGTTANAVTRIVRDIDYAPQIGRAKVNISQRIANQTIRIGLSEAFATSDRWFARFSLSGTTATTVVCESGRNPTTTPSASETESTTVTLPFGLTTALNPDYRIEQLTESCRFYVNGVVVAEHTRSIPAQHDEMEFAVTCINGAVAPASSTTVTVDYVTGKNHNKLEIGVMSDAEKIVAAAAPLQQFSYGPQAGVIAINTDLIVLDCSQLRSLFIQCNSMGTTGVVTVAWSNEPTFAQPITATLASETGALSTTFNAAGMRATNVMARYCRIRLTTATTAGTTTLNVWGAQTTYVPLITNQNILGSVAVNAGTTLMGDVGQQYRANATGAASGAHVVSAATTNATIVKASAGRVLRWSFGNTSAVWQYVKLHNQTTLPTAGTGVARTIAIPPGGRADGGLEGGVAFATGIGMTIVTGSPDADATATTVGAVVGDLFFA
jgi:hypothetical protein